MRVEPAADVDRVRRDDAPADGEAGVLGHAAPLRSAADRAALGPTSAPARWHACCLAAWLMTAGRRVWVIADGLLPEDGDEAAGVLNAGGKPVDLEVTVYFADREPGGPYRARVAAGRVVEVPLGEMVDAGVEYAAVIQASGPVVVQHVRRDARPPHHALASTIPWAAG